MSKSSESIDWYGILGCTIDSTKEDIAKAARKKALKYHPDRNSDPTAKEIFLHIQNAKDFLLDDVKRREFDEIFIASRKRKEYEENKNKNMDAKRKKMKIDFEARLHSARNNVSSMQTTMSGGVDGKQTTETNDFETRQKMNNLKRESAEMMERSRVQAEEREIRNKEASEFKRYLSTLGTGAHSVRVKWRTKDIIHTEITLHQLFKIHGSIEHVRLVEGKGNQAVIEYSKPSMAQAAVIAHATSEELRVTGLTEETKRKAAVFTHIYKDQSAWKHVPSSTSATTSGFGSNTPGFGSNTAGFGSNTAGFGSNMEREMKRAVEREELLKALQSEGVSATSTTNTMPKTNTNNESTSSTSSTIPSSIPVPVDMKSKESDIIARMKLAALLRQQKKSEGM